MFRTHSQRTLHAHMPQTRMGTHTHAVTLPPSTGRLTHSKVSCSYTYSPGKVSMGCECGVLGCWTDGILHLSCLPAWPVFVQLFSLPQVWGGGRKSNIGEGADYCGPNQEFHTPKGTGPFAKPTSSWVKAQSWLCSQAAGDFRGPSLDGNPSQLRGLGSKCFGGLCCAWVLPAPAGCSAEGQQAPNGLQRPLLNCPFPGLIIGRCWSGYGPQILQLPCAGSPSETEHMRF